MAAYYIKKQRSQQLDMDSELEMQIGREDKGWTKIHTDSGRTYALVNKIPEPEAQLLKEQTGLEVKFIAGKKKTNFTLGQGQFGKLRLAKIIKGKGKGQFVGVKKIKDSPGRQEIADSKQEAELQQRLAGGPHIMPLFDSIETQGSQGQPVLYQFMPLAGFGNGDELRDRLARIENAALKDQILTHVAKGLLTGVMHMHQQGIYHLDLKPSNFVLNNEGTLFIIDFGCAKALSDGQIKDVVVGDTRYFSPERLDTYRQLSLQQTITSFAADKVDAWALGVTLLELLQGAYPFEPCNVATKVSNWDRGYFIEVLGRHPALKNTPAGSVAAIAKGLLNPDPERRLTVAEALERLSNDLNFESIEAQSQVISSLKEINLTQNTTHIPRKEDENYPNVYIAKYGTVAPVDADANYGGIMKTDVNYGGIARPQPQSDVVAATVSRNSSSFFYNSPVPVAEQQDVLKNDAGFNRA